MGQAISLLQREEVINRYKNGNDYSSIGIELGLSTNSVRRFCKLFRDHGLLGLATNYDECGLNQPDRTNIIYRASLWLRRLHPKWGSPRIHIKLVQRYGKDIPSIRTLNRWFKDNNLTKPRNRNHRESIGQSKAVHNIWQVDAKEQLTLLDGQQACYLTITDERSGSWLTSLSFFLWTHFSSTFG